MDLEQIWTGYYMAAVAGGNHPGNATKNAQLADAMVDAHIARWPNGRVADEQRGRRQDELDRMSR